MLNSRQSPFSTYLSLLIASLMVSAAWASSPSPTTTTLTISPSPVSAQAAATLTAAVLSDGKPVTPGLVIFCDAAALRCTDIHILGQAQLTKSGVASIKLRLGIGEHSVKAEFQGTKTNAASSSSSQDISVTGKFRTSTDININLDIYYALVKSYGLVPATGMVRFLDATNAQYEFASAELTPFATVPQLSPSTSNFGAYTRSVVSADFNGDGIPDLAVTADPNVIILLGNGDGTFTEARTPRVGSGTVAMAVGDFNGDGIPDLAVAQSATFTGSGSVTVLLGNGDGSFTAKSTVSVGKEPQSVTVGDFNNDGIPDLVVANNGDSTVSVLLGNGDGTFSAGGTPNSGDGPISVAVADLNNDGIADLAVANFYGSSVGVLLGDGAGGFTLHSTIPVSGRPYCVAAGDFNGDGVPDLAIVNFDNSQVAIELGKGDGTFNSGETVAVGYQPSSVSVGDLNGDGILDLAVAQGAPLAILIGKGDGTFALDSSLNTGNAGGNAVVWGDFNGDGIADLATSTGTGIAVFSGIVESISSGKASNVLVPGGGLHHVFASKMGDAAHIGSTSPNTWSVRGTLIQTSAALTVSPGLNVMHGTTVQFTATLTPGKYANYIASGYVVFFNDNTALGMANVSHGQAIFSTNSLSPGSYHVQAVYLGDTNFAASTSPVVTVTVN